MMMNEENVYADIGGGVKEFNILFNYTHCNKVLLFIIFEAFYQKKP